MNATPSTREQSSNSGYTELTEKFTVLSLMKSLVANEQPEIIFYALYKPNIRKCFNFHFNFTHTLVELVAKF